MKLSEGRAKTAKEITQGIRELRKASDFVHTFDCVADIETLLGCLSLFHDRLLDIEDKADDLLESLETGKKCYIAEHEELIAKRAKSGEV